jgi:hypothetical protein
MSDAQERLIEAARDYEAAVYRDLASNNGQQQIQDRCQFCLGAKGGVLGNENVIGGVVVCDYCVVLISKMNEKMPPSADTLRLNYLEKECLEIAPADTYLRFEYETRKSLRKAIDEARQ